MLSSKNFANAIALLLIILTNLHAQSDERNTKDILRTPAEISNFEISPDYITTIEYARRLDAASKDIVLQSFGKSPEGRALPLLIASTGGASGFEPVENRKKAVVLIQAAIHSGEPDGKDAGFALFRDIALGRTQRSLLDDVTILFIPILNVDGHELSSKYNRINQNGPSKTGFRANSANLNLNRDYLKADTPEIRSWLKLWNQWKPDFFIDCHVTDGADFRYNITYEFSHHHEMNKPLTDFMKSEFEGKAIPAIEKRGHLLSRYIQMIDRRDPSKGIATFIATPRFATGYTALVNRLGLLIEAHSLKPFKSRVLGTESVLIESLKMVSRNKERLIKLNREADLARPESVVLRQRIGRTTKMIDFKGYDFELFDSKISGAKEIRYKTDPKDYRVPQYDDAVIVLERKLPDYYIVPPQWNDVIEVLSAHHVPYKRTKREIELKVESYRFENPKWRTSSFEGRIGLSAKKIAYGETRKIPANSLVISTDNRFRQVLAHFLEPDAPDSAFTWGFFNAIFERKEYAESYIMEGIANEMLKDEKIKADFEKKMEDPKFKASPRARIEFFYKRSKYYDQRIGKYPVSFVSGKDAARSLNDAIR